MDLLNFFASDDGLRMMLNGVQGQTWDYVNGTPQFKAGIYDIVTDKNNPNAAQYGYKKYSALAAFAAAGTDSNGQPLDVTFYPDFISSSMTAMEKDCAAFYKVTLPTDIYYKKQYTQYGNSLVSALPDFSSDYTQKDTDINTYIVNNWIKFVQAKDDAAYEAEKATFLKDLKDMGFDDHLAAFKQIYDTTQATLAAAK
jgi:hypothetical protein